MLKVLLIPALDDSNIELIKKSCPDMNLLKVNKEDLTQEMIDEADVIVGNPPRKFNLNRPTLKALLLNSAGNDQFLLPSILNRQTLLTNASGSYGHAICEHMMGMIFSFNKNLRFYYDRQKEARWTPLFTGREIYGSNVLLLGVGDIGTEFAKVLKVLGAHVTGLRNSYKEHPNCDEIITSKELHDVLPKMDYIITSLPATNATFHMLSHDEFSLMKEDAVVCNVGRGSVIDTYALLEALDNKSIGGALLDVFEEEPLPADSPLWKNPRVMITPHCSGGYHWKSVQDYYTQLVIRNLNHLKNQEPLENFVNRTKGY